MTRLSGKSIRDVIQEAGTITRKQIAAKLKEQEIEFNDPLLDGFLEQACERWLEVNDKGVYSIRVRVNTGGGTPTKLYRIDKPEDPVHAKLVEVPFDAKLEDKDPMQKRTANAAIKVAKAHWYNTVMVPQREAYRAMAAQHAPPKKEQPAEEEKEAA